jgi:hypothetical protein
MHRFEGLCKKPQIVIRLVGISAPTVAHRTGEPSQVYAHEALGYLTARALDQTIDLKGYGVDPRHRLLGIVTLDGTDLNLEMVWAGFARVDQQDDLGGLDLTPFRQAEQEAKTAGRGMWAQPVTSAGDGSSVARRGVFTGLPDWLIALLPTLPVLIYLGGFVFFPTIRTVMRSHMKVLAKQLPSLGDVSTLLGLVLATLTLVGTLPASGEPIRSDVSCMLLSGTSLFLFLCFVFSRFTLWWCVYWAEASITSGWYCLALSLFAALDLLLSDKMWRFVLVIPPLALLYYVVEGPRSSIFGGRGGAAWLNIPR